MSRYLSALLLGTLSLTATSCRSNCASRQGITTSNTRSDVPCSLTSGAGNRMMEGCYDAITGQPVPCPPSSMVLPSPTYQPPTSAGPRPDELPFPSLNDNIPRPNVPYAPPTPAPGSEGASLNPKGTTPVKATPKQ